MAEYIEKTDTLNEGREKLNEGIKASERAESKSDQAVSTAQLAVNTADTAESKADSVQQQFNNVVIEGDSSVEAAQARVKEDGYSFDTLRDRLNSSDANLAQNEENLRKSDLFNKLYGSTSLYNKPSGFTMNIPFSVYTSVSGKVEHNYNVSINKNSVSKRYYVDVNNGSNNNAGTEEAPFKSLERAFRYGDADEIILKSGVYDWSNGATGTAPISSQKKAFNLIGDGDVYLGAHRGYQTWTLVEGQTNVYHTSVSSVVEIVDIRNYADPLFYEQLGSVAEVAGRSGSYYVNGSDVYVRTSNNAKPNDRILLNMLNNALQLDDFENVYLENIKFTNTLTVDNPNTVGRLYSKNCDFMFGTSDNSLSIFGEVYSIFQDCRAMYAERDGFNYHVRNGRLPSAIEIDCIGAFNGRDGANQNNGSTMHDGGSVLRINGEYHHNHGPNVIDVNPGTKSLNLGVHAHHSTATASLSNVDFRTRDADMWLVNCVSHNSEYTTSKEGTANLYKDNSLLIGEEFAA